METFGKTCLISQKFKLIQTRTILMIGILIHVKIGNQFLICFSHVTMSISSHYDIQAEN